MLPLLLILASIAQQAAIRALAAQDARVAAVGYRLATANAALCPGQSVDLAGLVVQDAVQYGREQQDDARVALGLGDGPTVVAVVPGSSAAAAGFVAGDRIVEIDGKRLPDRARDPYARVAWVEDELAANPSANVTALRSETRVALHMTPAQGCRSRFQIVPGGRLNGRADGRYVQLSSRLVDFATSDDELAFVAAHELAHNILQHGTLKTPSRSAEYAADRLAVWLVARAGYDAAAAVPFYQRVEAQLGLGALLGDGSHPGWGKRIAGLRVTLAELAAQRANGADLPPQLPASQRAIRR